MSIQPVAFSILRHFGDNSPEIVGDLCPAQVLAELTKRTRHDAASKDGGAFMVARFRGDPVRRGDAVDSVTALVLDLDKGESVRKVRARLDALELAYLLWPSYNHGRPKGDEPARNRARVIIFVTEAVPASEYDAWYPRAADFVVGPGNWDTGVKDAARLHYLPAHPVGVRGGIVSEIGEDRRALDPWRDVPHAFPAEPVEESGRPDPSGLLKPWDAFSASHGLEDVVTLLEGHGYHSRAVDTRTRGFRLARPGKKAADGRSVSVWPGDSRGAIVKVFSSNCEPLREGEVYDAFGLLVALEHDGDAKAATRAASAWLDTRGVPYSVRHKADSSARAVASQAPRRLSVKTFSAGDFEPEQVSFLIEPYFPRARAVLLDADGGTGKTCFMLALAAALSRGVNPLTGERVDPVKTLYLHRSEDSNEALETVYRENGGEPGFLHYCDDSGLFLDEPGCELLRDTIRAVGAGLVVVDALFYFLPNDVRDGNHAIPVMPVMERMNRLVKDTGVCWVNIRHTSKGRVGKAVSDYGLGSVQFRNSHRGQLVARFHPDEDGLVVVTDEKGSLLVHRGEPFGFRREGHRIIITHDFDMDAFKQKPASKLDEAKEFLTMMLADGAMDSDQIETRALESGITKATLRRAKDALGIIVQPVNDGDGRGAKRWRWQLPAPMRPSRCSFATDEHLEEFEPKVACAHGNVEHLEQKIRMVED